MTDTKIPTVFISYSWSSAEYADRVDQLARDLAKDGVNVLLDQWDLKEGQDKHMFMERAVTDPSVDRVLILADPRYVERANRREGGVGTETLIISGEVYAQADQEKFIPVVMERDGEGKVRLPVYLKDRIYIDLSDPERYTDQYERLLRNVHGKPERSRPELGRPPAYLASDAPQLSTGQALPMFRASLLQDRASQIGYLDEYLDRFLRAFQQEAIDVPNDVNALEEGVSESIERLIPYRDEFIDMVRLLARHGRKEELFDKLHSSFERMATIQMMGPQKFWESSIETENLSFVAWELFLYSAGMLLRAGAFDAVGRLLRPYYVRSRASGDGVLRTYGVLNPGFRLIQGRRQERLGTRWHDAAGQLLRERAGDDETFEMLTETDSVLWVRSMLSQQSASWWPHTAVYRENYGWRGMPVWARAAGDYAYFARLAPILGVSSKADAQQRIGQLHEASGVHIGFMRLDRSSIAEMLGLKESQ